MRETGGRCQEEHPLFKNRKKSRLWIISCGIVCKRKQLNFKKKCIAQNKYFMLVILCRYISEFFLKQTRGRLALAQVQGQSKPGLRGSFKLGLGLALVDVSVGFWLGLHNC